MAFRFKLELGGHGTVTPPPAAPPHLAAVPDEVPPAVVSPSDAPAVTTPVALPDPSPE